MAIGDWTIQNSLSNTAQVFVPVAGTVFLITGFSNGGSGSSEVPSFNTSVGYSEMIPPNANTGSNSTIRANWDYAAMKIAIDNTHSVRVPPSGLATATVLCMVQVA